MNQVRADRVRQGGEFVRMLSWLSLAVLIALAVVGSDAGPRPARPFTSPALLERHSENGDERLDKTWARLAELHQDLAHLATLDPGRQSAVRDVALRSIWDDIFKLILSFIFKMRDPTPLGDYAWHFDGAMARGDLSLQGLQARHLKELKVQKFDIDPYTMCAVVNILLPRLTLETKYDTDLDFILEEGSNSDFRFFGKGQAKVDMGNIKLSTDLCVDVSPLSAKVANIKLSVEKDNVDVQNLFLDPPLSKAISQVATDVLPSMVEEFQKEITDFITTYINNLLEDKLPHNSTLGF